MGDIDFNTNENLAKQAKKEKKQHMQEILKQEKIKIKMQKQSENLTKKHDKKSKNYYSREKKSPSILLEKIIANDEKIITQIIMKNRFIVFTDHRLVFYNKKMALRPIIMASVPYSKIASWIVKYNSVKSKYPVLKLSILGTKEPYSFRFDSTDDVNVLNKILSHFCN